jgi:hypothetical protein
MNLSIRKMGWYFEKPTNIGNYRAIFEITAFSIPPLTRGKYILSPAGISMVYWGGRYGNMVTTHFAVGGNHGI